MLGTRECTTTDSDQANSMTNGDIAMQHNPTCMKRIWPLNDELCDSSDWVGLAEDEERGGALAVLGGRSALPGHG